MKQSRESMGQGAEVSGLTEVKTKLVVVGDCGCGKTSLIKRYVNSTYTDVSFHVLFTCFVCCVSYGKSLTYYQTAKF